MVHRAHQRGQSHHRCADRCAFRCSSPSMSVSGIRGARHRKCVLLWIGGVAPWTVLPQDLAGMDSGHRQLRFRGRCTASTSGDGAVPIWAASIVISQGSLYLAIGHVPISVAAIAVPGVILALGLDPTDLADGLVADSAPARNVSYTAALAGIAHVHAAAGRLARTRPVTPLAWPRRRQHHQTRLLASIQPARRYPSDVERNSPPPWKRADSDPTRHEAKRANRNCMRSTGCSTPSASRCRQSRWPPHTTPATGIGRSATCPTNG